MSLFKSQTHSQNQQSLSKEPNTPDEIIVGEEHEIQLDLPSTDIAVAVSHRSEAN